MPKAHRKLPQLTPQDTHRFWSKIDKRGPDECWPWKAGHFDRGYGAFWLLDRNVAAHRVAFFLATGEDPGDLCGLHRCDNPPCCNPAHVFKGTGPDNRADCVAKGRQAKGDRQGARLHPETLHRGDAHWARRTPERLKRGDQHPARLRPERVARGERHGMAKLTDAQVQEAIDLRARGWFYYQIGSHLGISATHAHRICKGRSRVQS